jgi:short-subunit dehydrogenase
MKLRGKTIVITGSTSGIGKQLAESLVARENSVVIVGHRRERVESTVEELHRLRCGSVKGFVCDLASRDDVLKTAAAIEQSIGDVNCLINNAGFGVYRTFEASAVEEIERLFAVNITGHLLMTKALLAGMIRRRSGAIGNVASIAGVLPVTPNATYCAAKHAMVAFSAVLREEVHRFGVSVTAILPGRVETPFFEHETFARRVRGPEARWSVSVKAVARATIRAIEEERRITYVPGTLAPAVWAFGSLSFIFRPLYAAVVRSRIEAIYANRNAT